MKRFKEDTDKWEKRVETILGDLYIAVLVHRFLGNIMNTNHHVSLFVHRFHNFIEEKLIAQADRLCAMYDYDKAIATIQSYEKYSEFTEMTEAIKTYEKEKSKAVKYDNMTESHRLACHFLQ